MISVLLGLHSFSHTTVMTGYLTIWGIFNFNGWVPTPPSVILSTLRLRVSSLVFFHTMK